MTRSPEALRFLELLLPEFIMASALGLFYVPLNSGSYSSQAGLTHLENTHTHTYTHRHAL